MYNAFRLLQQSIYLEIIKAFEEKKIAFAYRIQTVFVNTIPTVG